MAEIKLLRGEAALVDDEDLERVSQFQWRRDSNGYVSRSEGNSKHGTYTTIYLHRVIMNAGPGEEVDHRHGNRLDNRKTELRCCSHRQNICNGKKKSNAATSKFKGVSWNSQNMKYEVHIRAEGKHMFLGYFGDEVKAHEAYKNAAIKYHGEFANY